MGKLIKIVLGLVAICAVLVAAGGAILGAFFNPNDFKAEIEQAALEKSGIELKIGGEISWSVFPWLGLSVAEIDANFPQRAPLAHLGRAEVSVKLAPLLSGQIQMSNIVISGLELNLVKDKDGNTNWVNPPSSANLPNTQPNQKADGSELTFDIESIQLSNALVTYQDNQSGQTSQLSNVNLTTDRIQNNQPFNLSLGLLLKQTQGSETVLQAAAQLASQVTIDLPNQRYTINNLGGDLELQNGANLQLDIQSDNIQLDLLKRSLMVNTWAATFADLKLSGKLNLKDLDTLAMAGSISAEPFALNSLLMPLGQAPIETTDPNVLKRISFNSSFSGNSNAITSDHLDIKVDDTLLQGNAGINLKTGRINIKLAGDSINVDRYLPPTSQTVSTEEADTKQGYSKEEIIPLEPLQQLNLAAALTIKDVTANKMKLSNVDVSINANKGLVEIPRLNVNLYGGSVKNKVVLDARRAPLKISSEKSVNGIQIGDMLVALTGESQPAITGTLSSSSSITTKGQSIHSLINHANGNANLSVSNGVVNGINMAQEICQTINTLSALGTTAPAQTVDTSTPFAKMGGNFSIKNGVISNQDLKAQLDAMLVKGQGAVDLPNALVDYQLALVIQENLFKKTCPVNNRLEGVEWPIRCKGSFDQEPTELCKPDTRIIRDILKKAVTDKVKEELGNKVKDQLKDKLKDDEAVKGLLKGLFK
jgi:uncharacterized protein involved in outer membrane biogenesis